jgi:hypothetical protein
VFYYLTICKILDLQLLVSYFKDSCSRSINIFYHFHFCGMLLTCKEALSLILSVNLYISYKGPSAVKTVIVLIHSIQFVNECF